MSSSSCLASLPAVCLHLIASPDPCWCREWGIRVQDWQTQCSMSASHGRLTYRLRRLLPVAGCEEDSISFEEESFTNVLPHRHEPCTPKDWPGSYAMVLQQSDSPNGHRRLRMEHCLMVAAEERLRIVQHAVQGKHLHRRVHEWYSWICNTLIFRRTTLWLAL